MYSHSVNYRVCYADTDRMGHMYYGSYARILEIARVELIRSLGMSYAELEDLGLILPVRNYSIKFIRSALYDDLLRIDTVIPTYPDGYRLEFGYRIFSCDGSLLARASIELYILQATSKKPGTLPELFLDKLRPYFEI